MPMLFTPSNWEKQVSKLREALSPVLRGQRVDMHACMPIGGDGDSDEMVLTLLIGEARGATILWVAELSANTTPERCRRICMHACRTRGQIRVTVHACMVLVLVVMTPRPSRGKAYPGRMCMHAC